MARAKKICARPGCPHVANGRYCAVHNRAYEAARGTREQRGYDHAHRSLRKAFAPEVEAGFINCWRCGQPIQPGEAWDLGHDDDDRTIYRGPEHAARCNRSAAGRLAHAQSDPNEAP